MTGVEVVELCTSPAQQGSYTIPCSPLLRWSYFETVVAEMFLVAMNTVRQRFPRFITGPVRHEILHRLGVKPPFTRLGFGRHARHVCFEVSKERLAVPKCRVIANAAGPAQFQRLCPYMAVHILVSGNLLRPDTNHLPKSPHAYFSLSWVFSMHELGESPQQ